MPENLLESELFGHVRGAFTGALGNNPGKFALASGGTLLLDEIGEMPLLLQPKLLRVLQEREFYRLGDSRPMRVDVRVIASTNRPLQALVAEGRFREDLYYRLNVIPLALPPLRERGEDVMELAEYFAAKFAAPNAPPPMSDRFSRRRCGHIHWPGNVRELANTMRRAVALCDGEEIGGARPASDPRPGPFRRMRLAEAWTVVARAGEDAAGNHFACHRRQPHPRGRVAGGQPAHRAQQDPRAWPAAAEAAMSSLSTPLIDLLGHALDLTAQRQSLVSQNIANIDTPGLSHSRHRFSPGVAAGAFPRSDGAG